jgi:hypothetical protein
MFARIVGGKFWLAFLMSATLLFAACAVEQGSQGEDGNSGNATCVPARGA